MVRRKSQSPGVTGITASQLQDSGTLYYSILLQFNSSLFKEKILQTDSKLYIIICIFKFNIIRIIHNESCTKKIDDQAGDRKKIRGIFKTVIIIAINLTLIFTFNTMDPNETKSRKNSFIL